MPSHIHLFSSHFLTKFTLIASLFFLSGQALSSESFVQGCTHQEQFSLPGIPLSAQESLRALAKGEVPPGESFVSATATKSLFHFYWLARAYYEANLYEAAFEYFIGVVNKARDKTLLPLRVAAMDCIVAIRKILPNFVENHDIAFDFPKEKLTDAVKIRVYEAQLQNIVRLIQSNSPKEKIEKRLKDLQYAGAFGEYANALWKLKLGHSKEALFPLTQLLARKPLPEAIEEKRNELLLLMAKIYYESGKYREALMVAEKIDKKSSRLVGTLNLVAWSHLLRNDIPKAIGVASSLDRGKLKRNFSPESQLIIAIGLSEVCHYPLARGRLNAFKETYHLAFTWLKDHLPTGKLANDKLYPQLIAFLNEKKNSVPEKVGSEWLKSSIFVTQQEAINFNIKRKRTFSQLRTQGVPNTNWRRAITDSEKAAQSQLLTSEKIIEEELQQLNRRMHSQLLFVAENSDLLDAEITTEGNSDLVRQQAITLTNSNREEAESNRHPSGFSADIYNWGVPYSSASNTESNEELWTDELDTMKANFENKCPPK